MCLFFYANFAWGQATIVFVPEVQGTTLNGLFRAAIYNPTGIKSVRMNIVVSETRAGRIATIQTVPFQIGPGSNVIPSGVARSASIAIAQNTTANFIRRNQYFPQGDYEYAFNIISASSSEEVIVDQTFNHEVTPPAPLDLIEPYDQDEICEKRPLLTWQPSLPAVDGQLYQLLLVEIKDKQNAVEALNYNLPVVNQKGIPANLLVYPPNAKELVAGKKYAWQVSAYKDQTIINRSDVWSFEVNCPDTMANAPDSDLGYRDIEDLAKGNFYVANGILRFSLINSNQEQQLRYSIICISNKALLPRRLKKIQLTKGVNKIKLDFTGNAAFKDGEHYVMRVTLPDGTTRSIRFTYKAIQ
ncbi:DUF928 domain-containing protein [Pedobacter frigidisoli]|uniref:DUF928 domain-containing protein n=1 Tax=Pedobacter frigidisoli TaxID=2530455 RepID=UPI002930C01A|nr:DUF928 domain-containing protein [Pedobacter frigidisoli]